MGIAGLIALTAQLVAQAPAPPGVPADRVAALRDAMMATFKDPRFVAECDSLHLECRDPKSGAELAQLIDQAYATPREIRRRLVAIQNGTYGH